MALHTVSDSNPVYVTGADNYRVSFTGFLTPDHPKFQEMLGFLNDKCRRRPEGFGLMFLESEEHSFTYFGPIEQVRRFQEEEMKASPAFDFSQGFMVEFWPHGRNWEDFIPDITWNQEGEGIVTEFDHPVSGKVVVYEFLGSWLKNRPKGKMVNFHCTNCHTNTFHDSGMVHSNRGPSARRIAARQAREHVHNVHKKSDKCLPADPEMMRVVNEVSNRMYGTNNPEITWEQHCNTEGPCSEIRRLRARA